MIKIAFFSFADIDNFGDILFSHVFKMQIELLLPDVQIDFYTPSNYEVEGIKYQAYNREKIINGHYTALILFGGEVIHLFDTRTWQPIYKKNKQTLESSLPSDVVFDWVDIPNCYKAWVSVGVRPIEGDSDYEKILDAIDHLDYISVRGQLSKKILENNDMAVNLPNIDITPDMGWLFPKFLEYANGKGQFYKKYIAHECYMVFQINNITSDEARLIGEALLNFQTETQIPVYLLPVIRPWEDYKYLQMINEQMGNSFTLLPNDLSILEIADILVHAKMILCSSLHACITGLAASVPAAIINKWQGTKLQDMFGHQFRMHMLQHDLKRIPHLLEALHKEVVNESPVIHTYATLMRQRLEFVFKELVDKIQQFEQVSLSNKKD